MSHHSHEEDKQVNDDSLQTNERLTQQIPHSGAWNDPAFDSSSPSSSQSSEYDELSLSSLRESQEVSSLSSISEAEQINTSSRRDMMVAGANVLFGYDATTQHRTIRGFGGQRNLQIVDMAKLKMYPPKVAESIQFMHPIFFQFARTKDGYQSLLGQCIKYTRVLKALMEYKNPNAICRNMEDHARNLFVFQFRQMNKDSNRALALAYYQMLFMDRVQDLGMMDVLVRDKKPYHTSWYETFSKFVIAPSSILPATTVNKVGGRFILKPWVCKKPRLVKYLRFSLGDPRWWGEDIKLVRPLVGSYKRRRVFTRWARYVEFVEANNTCTKCGKEYNYFCDQCLQVSDKGCTDYFSERVDVEALNKIYKNKI